MKLRRRRRRPRPATACSATPPSQAAARAYAPALLFPSFLFSLPPPRSTTPHPPPPSLPSATDRKSNALQLSSSPAVPLLPSFFIKLLKRKSVEGRTVAGAQLADPIVLLNDNRARPARRTLPLPVASLSSTVSRL